MDYIDGKLIVDEIIIDPSLPGFVILRIGAEFYRLRNNRTMNAKVEEKDLLPYKKQPNKEWYRPTSSHNFWMHGLVPRGGYQVEIGRPITDKEFSEIVEKYALTEDDISDAFTDSSGNIFGDAFSKSFSARQIRVKTTDEALTLERELLDRGIQATNGSPDRVNIRVDQPVKQ